MRLPALLVLISACAPADEIEAPLASYHELQLQISEHGLDVLIGEAQPYAQAAPCPLASAYLTAHLGDVPLTYESRGGKIGDEPGDDVSDNVCGQPRFHLDQPATGPAQLVVAESAASSILCRLPDLVSPRALSADTWTWTAGTVATIRWTPVDDAAHWDDFAVTLDRLKPDGVLEQSYPLTDVTMGGGLIRFTVPAAPAGPRYVIAVQPRPTVRCDAGVIANLRSTQTSYAARHDVTIAP